MSTDKLMETLKSHSITNHKNLKKDVLESSRLRDLSFEHAVNRLESTLQPFSSIEEFEERLPPAALYLGPGAWINAIKNSVPMK
jgi:hypothetical protein